nr:PQQ-like beta-propeller repeat protein [Natrinema longum]
MSGLTERWSVDVQHPGQPIVLNGSVLVGGIRSPDFIRSYSLYTGEEQWLKRISAGHHVSLVAGGDSLFLGDDREDGERVSRALATADGSDRWTSAVSGGHVIPLLEAGLLAFYDSPDLIGVDAHTGEECWRKSLGSRIRSTALDADDTVVLDTGTDGNLFFLEAETGERRRETDISRHFHPNEGAVTDAIRGRIVAGSERIFFNTFGGLLIALDADTGETDWVTPETHPEIDGNTALPEREPIAVSNDSLLVIESDGTDRSDSLYAVDPATGSEQWVFDPEEETDVRIRSAAVAGETVFLSVMDELLLIDLASGDVFERHDCDSHVQSVTLAGGVCLVATAEGIVAFEAA